MEYVGKNIKKLCSFYVSDWHLSVMLLPYINEEINQDVEIATILQNNIEENIKTLVKKLNLKNENKILNIDWSNTEYCNIEEKISKIKSNENQKAVIINGTEDFIEKCNKEINNKINNVKIINCYETSKMEFDFSNLLENYDGVLNTSGEKQIEEVFGTL